jgi:hypothetical protein
VGEDCTGGGSTGGGLGGATQSDDLWLVVVLEEKDLLGIMGALGLEVVVDGVEEILGVVVRDLT